MGEKHLPSKWRICRRMVTREGERTPFLIMANPKTCQGKKEEGVLNGNAAEEKEEEKKEKEESNDDGLASNK